MVFPEWDKSFLVKKENVPSHKNGDFAHFKQALPPLSSF